MLTGETNSGKELRRDRKDPEMLATNQTVTTVKVDLDVDTNNDGSIDTANTGEDGYEEYEPGVLVCRTIPGDSDAPFHHTKQVNLVIDGGASSSALADCKVTLTCPSPYSPSANHLEPVRKGCMAAREHDFG